MLRNGRLLHLQSIHNLPHRPLLERQIVEYLSPPRFRHSIKRIRSRCRSWHGSTIHTYMGICQALFFASLRYLLSFSEGTAWGLAAFLMSLLFQTKPVRFGWANPGIPAIPIFGGMGAGLERRRG